MLNISIDKCNAAEGKPPYSYVALIAMAIDVSIAILRCLSISLVRVYLHQKMINFYVVKKNALNVLVERCNGYRETHLFF